MINRSYRDLFIRILLGCGIPMGIFVGVFSFVLFRIKFGLYESVLLGAIVGIVAGILSGNFYASLWTYATKLFDQKNSITASERLLGLHQIQVGTLNLPFDKSFDRCIAAMDNICEISYIDRSNGIIRGNCSWSIKSFGEAVLITVTEHTENSCKIVISSKPKQDKTLVDYGKNLENIRSIQEFLKDELVSIDCK